MIYSVSFNSCWILFQGISFSIVYSIILKATELCFPSLLVAHWSRSFIFNFPIRVNWMRIFDYLLDGTLTYHKWNSSLTNFAKRAPKKLSKARWFTTSNSLTYSTQIQIITFIRNEIKIFLCQHVLSELFVQFKYKSKNWIQTIQLIK